MVTCARSCEGQLVGGSEECCGVVFSESLAQSYRRCACSLAWDSICCTPLTTVRAERRTCNWAEDRFGLSSARFTSPLAFIASFAASAAQPGVHPLSGGVLPSVSLLHQWLRTALTCPTVTDIQDHGCTGMSYDADSFITHFHNQPSHASNLQHRLTTVATNCLYSARVSQLRGVGGAERELARLYGGKARYAARWKTVRPTETAYRLSDEFLPLLGAARHRPAAHTRSGTAASVWRVQDGHMRGRLPRGQTAHTTRALLLPPLPLPHGSQHGPME